MNLPRVPASWLLRSALVLAILGAGHSAGQAATASWTGSAGDGRWSSAGNWLGNVLPANGDDLYFQLTADAAMIDDLPADRTFVQVTFDRLGGGSDLVVTVSGNGFTATQLTIGPPMQVQLGCPFGGAGATLTLEVYGKLTLGAPLTGQQVIQNHVGEIVLGAAPLISGGITVNQGILALSGGITATAPLALAGGLASRSGDNRWSGPITLSGWPYVSVEDVPAGGGRLTLSGGLSGSGGLGKAGAGVLVLAGPNTVTGSGTVQIDGGTLVAAAANALPAGSSLVLAGGHVDLGGFATTLASINGGGGETPADHSGILALGGATLTLTGAQPTSGFWNGTITGPGEVHMTGNGWWEQNGVVQVPVRIDGGELDGTGTFTRLVTIGAATVSPGSDEWQEDPGTLTFAGGLTLNDASVVIMDVGIASSDHLVIQGPAALAGTLILRPLAGPASAALASIAHTPVPLFSTTASLFTFTDPPTGRVVLGPQPAGFGCTLQWDASGGGLMAAVAPAPSGNVPPIASDVRITVTNGGTTTAWLWASDANGDPVTYALGDYSSNVHIEAFDAQAGTVRFTAWNIPSHQAWVHYTASDGQAASAQATVSITVDDPDQPNVAVHCGIGAAWTFLVLLMLGMTARQRRT